MLRAQMLKKEVQWKLLGGLQRQNSMDRKYNQSFVRQTLPKTEDQNLFLFLDYISTQGVAVDP